MALVVVQCVYQRPDGKEHDVIIDIARVIAALLKQRKKERHFRRLSQEHRTTMVREAFAERLSLGHTTPENLVDSASFIASKTTAIAEDAEFALNAIAEEHLGERTWLPSFLVRPVVARALRRMPLERQLEVVKGGSCRVRYRETSTAESSTTTTRSSGPQTLSAHGRTRRLKIWIAVYAIPITLALIVNFCKPQ